MDDLSNVREIEAMGWIISADRLREQIRNSQRTGHANAFGQRVFVFTEPDGLEQEVLCITDLFDPRWPTKSVTNDAEHVIATFREHIKHGIPVIYRDTEGNWDEMRHREGYFATFRALNTRDQQEAIRTVLALHEKDREQYEN